MCRWVIMACSRSLSLASCGEAGGELGTCARGSPALFPFHFPNPYPQGLSSLPPGISLHLLLQETLPAYPDSVSPAWSPAQPLPVGAHFSQTAHAFSPPQGQRLWLKFSGTCVCESALTH